MLENGGVETPETTDASEEVAETPASEEATTETSDDSEESPSKTTVPTVPITELRKVRSEAAKYRKRLNEIESRMEKEKRDAELAKMEETDRLKAIAAEAEAKSKSLKERADRVAKRAAIVNAASLLNFNNPAHAAGILDLEQVGIDDEGKVDEGQITDMLNELAEKNPYLVKSGEKETPSEYGGGPTNPAPPPDSQPRSLKFTDADKIQQMREQANKLTYEGKAKAASDLLNRAWEMEREMRKTGG